MIRWRVHVEAISTGCWLLFAVVNLLVAFGVIETMLWRSVHVGSAIVSVTLALRCVDRARFLHEYYDWIEELARTGARWIK